MRFIIIFFFVLIQQALLADDNISFRHLTVRDGLSQNDVTSIYQDSQGFMWFGTFNGLNRYDGYEFKTYRSSPDTTDGLNASIIFALAEDSKQNLWIGTTGQGISKFNLRTQTFTNYIDIEPYKTQLQNQRISCMTVDSKDNLWFGIAENGIGHITQNKDSIHIEYLFPNLGSVRSLFVDKYNRLWVLNNSLHIIEPLKEGETEYKLKKVKLPSKYIIPSGQIKGHHDMVYFTSFEGVFRARIAKDPDDMKFKKISENHGSRILVHSSGDIWCGSRAGLTWIKRENTGRYSNSQFLINDWADPTSLSKNTITDIYEDNSGIVWIATYGGGVNIFNPNKKRFQHYKRNIKPHSLSYNRVIGIYEDSEQNLWIGTEGGGVNFLRADSTNYNSSFERIVSPNYPNKREEPPVYTFSEIQSQERNMMLIGVSHPFCILDVDMNVVKSSKPITLNRVELTKSQVFSIKKCTDGYIWIGTYDKGLLRGTELDGKFESFLAIPKDSSSIASNIIRSIIEDFNGNIWIGTSNGLSLLTADEKRKSQPKFVNFRNIKGDTNSLSDNYILPLHQSKSGGIWVGTMSGGINRFKKGATWKSSSFVRYTMKNGLPSNSIKGILEDNQGNLWISSTRGLSKFTPSNLQITNYDVFDGLQDNEFSELSCCKRANGELVFGGVNGFNVFRPFEITNNLTPPEVLFAGLEVNNKAVAIDQIVNNRVILTSPLEEMKKIILESDERSFAVKFVGLHYEAPTENSYRYKLEGFDKAWVQASSINRTAKYTNIPPGTYTLKVKAANSDGIWTKDIKELKIRILSPFYLRWWAFILYGILVIYLIYLRKKYSIIATNEKNSLMMEHFEKEKMHELTQSKLQFFTNISHELRTPITLITAPLEKIHLNFDTITDTDKKNLLSVMYKNSSYLLRLINQLLDFRKIEFGKKNLKISKSNIDNFCKEIVGSFVSAANEKNITIEYSNPEKIILVWLDFGIIEKILFNILSNAVKYTPAGGQVQLRLKREKTNNKSFINITIEDNGIGIPKSEREHIFERFYRLDSAKSLKIDGSGIGLSYVKNLVELHHGQIECKSSEGKGAQFIVTLPTDKNNYAEHELREQTREVEPSLSASITPVSILPNESTDQARRIPSILIVEDNPDISQLIHSHLSGRYQIRIAENGVVALNEIKNSEPDLIVSDVMMPEMDGLELTRRVKESEQTCHLPIILLTAKISSENKIEGYKMGADGYLQKPFNLDVLETRIENILKQRKQLQKKYQKNIHANPREVATISLDEKFLNKVLDIIESNISNSEFTVNQLANDIGYSQPILNKKLKGLVGQSARAFIRNTRLKRAAQLLEKGRYSIAEITYEVGFNDLKYFRNCFKEEFDLTPSDYIKDYQRKQAKEND